MRRLIFVLSASVAAATLARAADLPLDSRIEAVTVFPDAAAVTRVGEVRIPAGQHALVLKGLPAAVDPASIRVEGAGEGRLVIGSADIRRAPASTQPTEEAQRRLKDLRGQLARVQGRVDALETQKRAVSEFARISAEAAAKEGRGFDIAQARAAWQAVGEATAAANQALQEEGARAAELEAEIRAVEAAASRPRTGLVPLVDLAVAVEAEREAAAVIRVTYRVSGARWSPVYDARLDTDGAGPPRVELVRRAAVTQRTGEDWSEVALTLSTARVTGGAAAPEVATQALNLRDPIVVFEQRQRMTGAAAPMAAAPSAEAQRSAPAAAEIQAAREQEASLAASAFSAAFVAPGRVSVSGDGAARTLRLSSHQIEATLLAKVAPALETRAYLSASLPWSDDAPLLPGEVSLTRDGVFVGKARIGTVPGGDRFELGFGADDRIKVERVPVRRRDNDPSGWSASRTQISDHRTAVTNLHKRPMRVSVIDRIPVSENSAVTVEPLPTNTAPTERSVQDRRGVMGWTHEHQPGEKREIRLGWRLRWPADRELISQ